MKVFIIVAVLVACARGGILPKLSEKVIPSFKTGLIINGEDAQKGSAPYIVSLSRYNRAHKHFCAGSIINKEWILTAAHCVYDPTDLGILAGLHNQSDPENGTQMRRVDSVRIHEDYKGGVGPFDIALLHISPPLKLNKRVQVIALPAVEEIHSGEVHLYGWGQEYPYIFKQANTLKTVRTRIVPFDICNATLPKGAPLHENNVCSSSLGEKISACNGDSGGPLVREHKDGTFELVGCVSWGYVPCGNANYPSVHTRISAYIEWIFNTMRKPCTTV